MLSTIRAPKQSYEQVIIIEPQELEHVVERLEAQIREKEAENEMDAMSQMEREYQRLVSHGSRDWTEGQENASEEDFEDLKKKYEEEIRKEMYGEEYEKVKDALNKQVDKGGSTDGYSSSEEQGEKGEKYSGPALVSYKLEDTTRTDRYLDIPVYECYGSGLVVIGIEVNARGDVLHTEVMRTDVSSDRECLVNTALNAATMSVFSADYGAGNIRGKIFYEFVAQK